MKHLTSNYGFGDIICSAYYALSNNYNLFTRNQEWINNFCNKSYSIEKAKEIMNFREQFIITVLKNSNINFEAKNYNSPNICNLKNFYNEINFDLIGKINLYDNLNLNVKKNNKRICIHVKTRLLNKNYNVTYINKKISELLQTFSDYEIVLIGDRNPEKSTVAEIEYKINNLGYSFYKEIINNCEDIDLYDYTTDFFDQNNDVFIRDFKIMMSSEYVFSFGLGGPFCFSWILPNAISYNRIEELNFLSKNSIDKLENLKKIKIY